MWLLVRKEESTIYLYPLVLISRYRFGLSDLFSITINYSRRLPYLLLPLTYHGRTKIWWSLDHGDRCSGYLSETLTVTPFLAHPHHYSALIQGLCSHVCTVDLTPCLTPHGFGQKWSPDPRGLIRRSFRILNGDKKTNI